jgi:hypothetical protein
MATLTTGLRMLDVHALGFLSDGALVASNWEVEQATFGPIQTHYIAVYDRDTWAARVRYDVAAGGQVFITDLDRRIFSANNGGAKVFYSDGPEQIATSSHPEFRSARFSFARQSEIAIAGNNNATEGIQIWTLPPIP